MSQIFYRRDFNSRPSLKIATLNMNSPSFFICWVSYSAASYRNRARLLEDVTVVLDESEQQQDIGTDRELELTTCRGGGRVLGYKMVVSVNDCNVS